MGSRGFINIILVVSLLIVALFFIWGNYYIRRLNADMEFKREVDRLAFESANYEVSVLNGVSILNDAIISDDAIAGLITGGAVAIGGVLILTLEGAGLGLDFIRQGFDISKKILKFGRYIQKFQQVFSSIGTVAPYIPFSKKYVTGINNAVFIPIPFIPDFSSFSVDNSSTKSPLNKKQLTISYNINWNLQYAINGLVIEGLNRLEIEYRKSKNRLFPDRKHLKGKQKFCNASFNLIYPKKTLKELKKTDSGKKLLNSLCTLLWQEITGPMYEELKISAERGIDEIFVAAKSKILCQSQNLESDVSDQDSSNNEFKMPIPAVTDEKFYLNQSIGALGIYKVKQYKSSFFNYQKRDILDIPYEIIYSQAKPYSRLVAGGVPVVPDWKAVYTTAELFNMLFDGEKNSGY